MQSMTINDDFSEKTQAFEGWLELAGVHLNPSIKIADLRSAGKGRGVVAASNISSGDTLFTIPRAALLTHRNTLLTTKCPGLVEAPELENPWTALLLALLLETARPDSKWQPYINILPMKEDFNTLMFWSGSELAELQASSVREKVGKSGAEESFRCLMPLISNNKDAFGVAPVPDSELEQYLIQRCHVLASLIMAYAFDVEVFPRASQPDDDGYVTDEEESDLPKAMVPLADLLNADATFNNARLFYETDGVLAMRAIADIEEGKEIFNDYGPLPRSELARRYGYITDNYAQYDVVDIPLSLFLEQARVMLSTRDQDVLKKLSDMLECDSEDVPDGFALAFSDLEALEMGDQHELQEIFPVLQIMHDSGPSKDRNAGTWTIPYLIAVLGARLDQYPSTIKDDAELLLQSQSEPANRHMMAVTIRLGEKEILKRAIHALTVQGVEPPRKKQRR